MFSKCSVVNYHTVLLAFASTVSPTASPKSSEKLASSRRPENGQRLAGNVGNPETIQKRGSMIVTLCCRFRAAEGAAGESVTAFRGRRATGGSSLEAGRPRLRQRLLGRHRAGATLIAAAKWFRHSCRAENGGTKLRLGSVPAERFFPALAP